jgi:tetratricopeptide (TPR) repeat protein
MAQDGTAQDPLSRKELDARATEAREAGNFPEAIEIYKKAVEVDPGWGEGWWYIGTLSYDLDLYPEGRDAFRRYVTIDPESGPAWALLGLCEFQTREYDQALKDLRQSFSAGVAPGSHFYYVANYHLALLFSRRGEFEVAIDILQKLVLNHPDNPKLIEAFGIGLLRLPFLPVELPADRREAVLLAGQAGNYWATSRLEQAGIAYQELVTRCPEVPSAHYTRGVFLLLTDPDQAVKEFQREIEISPDHVPARMQLCFEFIKVGTPEKALPYAREAVELDPFSFVPRNALGRILLAMGQIDEAIKQLEIGVDLAPDSPEMYFSLARAYTKAGLKEEARRAREEFLRLDEARRGLQETPSSVAGRALPGPESEKP